MVSLDDETCIECGICVDILPQYFTVVGGRVEIRRGAGSLEDADPSSVEAASEDCPTGSIQV